jgi:hypothetical protein
VVGHIKQNSAKIQRIRLLSVKSLHIVLIQDAAAVAHLSSLQIGKIAACSTSFIVHSSTTMMWADVSVANARLDRPH